MGVKLSFTFTPKLDHGSLLYWAGICFAPWGRSRMWPMLASTVKPRPKYLLIVFAFAGDSTITSACSGVSPFVFAALRFAISHEQFVNLQCLGKLDSHYGRCLSIYLPLALRSLVAGHALPSVRFLRS